MKYLMTVLATFLFFLVSVSTLTAQNKNSIQGDFEALQDIYEVTDGDNWTNNSGWSTMTPENMGDAYGVTVNPQGRVTDLVLIENNLVNYKLDSEGKPILDADGYYQLISGRELKESIGNLQQMQHIAIQQNRLTGEIPKSFYTLSNLEYAFLGYNMTSDLRNERWPYPRKSDYTGNKFTGSIPPEIGNLISLKRLYLDRNYFTGTSLPSEIGQLLNLEHLSINYNGFNGTLPSSIGDLKNIEVLHLSGSSTFRTTSNTNIEEANSFGGAIPSAMGQLTNLKSLRIPFHRFTGGFPSSFANLENLQMFVAESALSSGDFPNHINNDNNPRMTTFFVSRSNLGGTIDPDWNGSNLDVFTIGTNNIGGELPKCFTDSSHPNFNTKLKMFTIQGNNFEGNFADTIEDWYRPRRIVMHSNNFSGPLPNVFPVYSSPESGERLMALGLSNNGFTGAIPLGLGAINSDLTFYIGLSNNNLSGYEKGAISPLIIDSNGDYVSGLRGMSGLGVDGNDLSQSDLDQIILDVWANVESRLGTPWEESGSVNISNQSTGAIPSYSSVVNTAINGLSSAGWRVIYDGWEDDDRVVDLPGTPSLLSPSDQSSDLSLTPTFEWENTGAPLYRLEVVNSSSNEPVLAIDQEQTVYKPDTELAENSEYTWRVRAIEGALQSDWSSSRSFTTAASERRDPNNGDDDGSGSGKFPDSPVQLSPAKDVEGVSVRPEFRWSSVDGADYYVLHMSRNSPTGMVIDVTIEDTVYTHPEKLGDSSTHHWRVRAVKNGEPGEWSKIFALHTKNEGQPTMPDLVSPQHYSENVSVTPRLEWDPVDSDRFKIRILYKDTSELVLSDEVSGNDYISNMPLTEETAYIWQVKNIKDGIEGAWSPRWEFTTGEYDYAVGSPFLLSPNKGTEYESLTPTFKWESVDADKYVISVSREAPTNAKVLSGADSETTVIYREVTDTYYTTEVILDPETTYFWHVKAIKNGEEGDWSDTWEFKTPKNKSIVSITPNETPLETDISQNYPNPFNPTTKIQYTLSDLQTVSLRVYDLAGRQVAVLVDGIKQAGSHTAKFDASNLASGVYIYRFISDTHQFTKKMTLVK